MLLLFAALPARAGGEPPVLMVLGDSISSGYGIDAQKGWVALLQQRLQQRGYAFRVVNASIAGDTTSAARARLPAALERFHPRLVIVELGGNDGLRGLSLQQMRDNLAAIIELLQSRGIRVLLAGMRLPPNYGMAYTDRFHRVYADLARHHHVPLVPFLLEGVAGHASLMQDDGIHPAQSGQARLVDNLWPYLVPLLNQADRAD